MEDGLGGEWVVDGRVVCVIGWSGTIVSGIGIGIIGVFCDIGGRAEVGR